MLGVVYDIQYHSVIATVNDGDDFDRHADEQWPLIEAAANYECVRLIRPRAVLDPTNFPKSATVREDNRISLNIVKLHTVVLGVTRATPAFDPPTEAGTTRFGCRVS